ncbi:hypothetical protein [Lewinella sp. LCG006]|uniref:hypothetical protein n=1 Tax=Lewinella sp. LCG006 TaxID=3231911 RepID=UPI0034609FA1
MSKRHPLDELFKNNLRDASAPVPDNMWERIARVRQQKRRRLVLIWSAVGTSTLGLLAFLLFPLSTPELGHFPLENTNTATASGFDVENPTALASSTTIQGENVGEQEHTLINVQPTAAPTNQRGQKYGEIAAAISPKTSATQPIRKISQNKLAANELQHLSSSQEVVEEITPVVSSEEDPPRIAGPHQRLRSQVVANLPTRNLAFAQHTELKLFANHAPRCARFANPYFRLDLEVLGGPAYAHQILQAKTPESIDHLNKRKESESSGLSHSSGFRLAASSNVGLSLRTGVMYSEINDRFTFEVGSEMRVSTLFGPNGEVIGVDTTYLEAYEEQHRNQLKFIEVPLLMGYEQQWGKFRVGVNAGAYLNLYFGAKGTIYSPATEEPTKFGQQGDRDVIPIFEQRATAAWYAGMSIAYNLHSRYSLIAEPYFKSYPRALSTSEYDLRQNYWMTGLQLGMRMRL